MYLYKEIKIPIYDCFLHFYITRDLKKKMSTINKKHSGDMTFKGEAGGLFFSLDVSNYFIILRDDQISYSKILHELMHFIDQISLDRDLECEARGYLNGFIGQEIIHHLLKKNIIII